MSSPIIVYSCFLQTEFTKILICVICTIIIHTLHTLTSIPSHSPAFTDCSAFHFLPKAMAEMITCRMLLHRYFATIADVLGDVEKPGLYCVGGPCKLSCDSIHVQELGALKLPLAEQDAKRLIDVCARSPFGMGPNTILDEKVRKSWQLEPSKFEIKHPDYVSELNELTKAAATMMGCDADTVPLVRASTYKLLLYETGGHFLPHRDSQKEDGMFGTLVVCLPSVYTGGVVLVRHHEDETVLELNDCSRSQFYAFYADCEHEITPVTSGYRLCITYNLIVDPASAQSKLSPKSSVSEAEGREEG